MCNTATAMKLCETYILEGDHCVDTLTKCRNMSFEDDRGSLLYNHYTSPFPVLTLDGKPVDAEDEFTYDLSFFEDLLEDIMKEQKMMICRILVVKKCREHIAKTLCEIYRSPPLVSGYWRPLNETCDFYVSTACQCIAVPPS